MYTTIGYKKIITALFIVFTVGIINAQTEAETEGKAVTSTKYGVRAGVNISKFTNKGFDNRTDFYAGGFIAIKFFDAFTLQPEITYSRQGAKGGFYEAASFDPIVPDVYREQDYEVQYISVGMITKVNIIKELELLIGSSLDFKTGDNFSRPADDNYDVVGFDIAVTGGISYTLPVGLTIEARYKLGMVDVYSDRVYNTYGFGYYDYDSNYNFNHDERVLNRLFQVGLAYGF